MNKKECKKYLRKAFNNLTSCKKSLTIENIEHEMEKIIKNDTEEYIAYSKIALNNMKNSGNLEIRLVELLSQIDILPTLYTPYYSMDMAKRL